MNGHTLYLTPDNWDITLDSSGRLQTSASAYAIAQNVANAVRLFTGEAFFAMDEGIPHFDIELGKTRPALSVLRARMREAALNVEGVLDAQITLDDVQERKLTGEILLTVADGDKSSKITLTL
jgi:hypothetical protein